VHEVGGVERASLGAALVPALPPFVLRRVILLYRVVRVTIPLQRPHHLHFRQVPSESRAFAGEAHNPVALCPFLTALRKRSSSVAAESRVHERRLRVLIVIAHRQYPTRASSALLQHRA